MLIKRNSRVYRLLVLVVSEKSNALLSRRGKVNSGRTDIHIREDIPHTVIPTPVMFSGVRSSLKNQAEIVMVVTSFAMPAMDMGTTPVR